MTDTMRRGLSTWREWVDTAAAELPGIGGLFARKWRVLRYDGSGLRYTNSEGESIEITAHENGPAAQAEIARLGRKGPLVLRIAGPMGFRRNASFPSAARKHLDEAIELALPRLSPLPPEDILFAADRSAMEESDDRISLPVSIVRRSALETALARSEELGLQPAAVDLENGDGSGAPVIDLREGRSAPSAGRSAFRLLGVISLVLVVAASGFMMDRTMRLDPQYAAARRPASLEARLQAAIEHAEAKSRAGSAVAALADLSRRLPDGAYITGFNYENGVITITGLAWDAAASLRALDSAAEFVDVAFDGATLRDEETGRERFQLTARHRIAEDGGGS
ncbi:PilN domain-containing protein [Hyphobacterium sp. HN65]|uniref:PilN domain-containing protein n=1 Tax=Hyphobacterium lacteum TaxID=3116575 RepID=A0ABU7LNV3_9PROT|nr:PilN domain-containing protein [Hyphobacterium sp. HN65]MEE2525567.1 PilN domain-containing protein [Hyphobacterium sp. HN65]